MDATDFTPALAAVPTINGLFTQLIERVKDGKTGTLVGQLQSAFQKMQSDYFEAKHESLKIATQNYELTRKQGQLEDTHTKTVAALNDSHAAAETALRKSHAAEIARLVADHQQAEADITAKQQQAASQYEQTIASLQQRIAELTPKPVIRRTAGSLYDAPTKAVSPHRKVLPTSGSKGQHR